MTAQDFEAQLLTMRSRIEPLERLISVVTDSLTPPIFYHSGQEHYGFRFMGKPGVRHFCLLKAVRVVSALNAMIALARGGYAQEIAVLTRTIVEYTTHIQFVLEELNESGALSPNAGKYVQDFFSDFARNSSMDFKRAQVRQSTVHKRLAAALDNVAELRESAKQVQSTEKLYSDIYLNFSNYVHAKYPEIMDLYGGTPGRFHVNGMRGTSKDEENLQTIDAAIEDASTTCRLMVNRLGLHQVVNPDAALATWFRGYY